MKTLFNDGEIFQKERPTNITEEQRKEYFEEFANEIIDGGFSSSTIEKIISDLVDLNQNENGYELSKELEDYGKKGSYNIDSSFVELMDSFGSGIMDIHRDNVRDWVLAHNIKPKYAYGQKFRVKTPIYYRQDTDTPLFITGIREEEGYYLVDSDKDRQGGICIHYEKIEDESNVILMES